MTTLPQIAINVHKLPRQTPTADEVVFAAARMKVDRAKTFIQELHRILLEYSENDPLVQAPTPAGVHPPGRVVSWRPIGLLPGAIVGDCLHNLRSSLDLMASELARRNGKGDKNVYFPVAETKDALLEQIKKKNFNRCGPEAVALLKTFAPYVGGNDRLRALHDLDVRDKHTALIPHQLTGHISHRAYFDPMGFPHVDLGVGRRGIRFVFPADAPFAEQPLIETLNELVGMVEGILDSFAALNSGTAR